MTERVCEKVYFYKNKKTPRKIPEVL